ncbi:hypothetical protein DFJ73DRAFT_872431 [Zopfochytrium polystomum]|nr:hypothetical protein DFJ73DRAFT_872431 [Zopfochytrium polystomum]
MNPHQVYRLQQLQQLQQLQSQQGVGSSDLQASQQSLSSYQAYQQPQLQQSFYPSSSSAAPSLASSTTAASAPTSHKIPYHQHAVQLQQHQQQLPQFVHAVATSQSQLGSVAKIPQLYSSSQWTQSQHWAQNHLQPPPAGSVAPTTGIYASPNPSPPSAGILTSVTAKSLASPNKPKGIPLQYQPIASAQFSQISHQQQPQPSQPQQSQPTQTQQALTPPQFSQTQPIAMYTHSTNKMSAASAATLHQQIFTHLTYLPTTGSTALPPRTPMKSGWAVPESPPMITYIPKTYATGAGTTSSNATVSNTSTSSKDQASQQTQQQQLSQTQSQLHSQTHQTSSTTSTSSKQSVSLTSLSQISASTSNTKLSRSSSLSSSANSKHIPSDPLPPVPALPVLPLLSSADQQKKQQSTVPTVPAQEQNQAQIAPQQIAQQQQQQQQQQQLLQQQQQQQQQLLQQQQQQQKQQLLQQQQLQQQQQQQAYVQRQQQVPPSYQQQESAERYQAASSQYYPGADAVSTPDNGIAISSQEFIAGFAQTTELARFIAAFIIRTCRGLPFGQVLEEHQRDQQTLSVFVQSLMTASSVSVSVLMLSLFFSSRLITKLDQEYMVGDGSRCRCGAPLSVSDPSAALTTEPDSVLRCILSAFTPDSPRCLTCRDEIVEQFFPRSNEYGGVSDNRLEQLVIVAGLILATKCPNGLDHPFKNLSWSQVSKIPARTLNLAELDLCSTLRWDMWVKEADYTFWLKSTESAVIEFEASVCEAAVKLQLQQVIERQQQQQEQQLQQQKLMLQRQMEVQQYQMRKLAIQHNAMMGAPDVGYATGQARRVPSNYDLAAAARAKSPMPPDFVSAAAAAAAAFSPGYPGPADTSYYQSTREPQQQLHSRAENYTGLSSSNGYDVPRRQASKKSLNDVSSGDVARAMSPTYHSYQQQAAIQQQQQQQLAAPSVQQYQIHQVQQVQQQVQQQLQQQQQQQQQYAQYTYPTRLPPTYQESQFVNSQSSNAPRLQDAQQQQQQTTDAFSYQPSSSTSTPPHPSPNTNTATVSASSLSSIPTPSPSRGVLSHATNSTTPPSSTTLAVPDVSANLSNLGASGSRDRADSNSSKGTRSASSLSAPLVLPHIDPLPLLQFDGLMFSSAKEDKSGEEAVADSAAAGGSGSTS